MRAPIVLWSLLARGIALAQTAPRPAAACERLASQPLPNASITLAQVVGAGAFTVPANPAARGGGGSSALAGTLRAVSGVAGRGNAHNPGVRPWFHRRRGDS